MKIAWFTPFSQHSAIGRVGQVVTLELSKEHDVTLWLDDDKELLETNVKKRFYSFNDECERIKEELQGYDHIFYNMGNYLRYHSSIFKVSQICPGIVILHDFIMQSFFYEYYLLDLKSTNRFVSILKVLYGSEGEKLAHTFLNEGICPKWAITEEAGRFPMFELALTHAKGAIVHSQFLKKKIQERLPIPVLSVSLPPAQYSPERVERDVLSQLIPDLGSRKILLSVGHVNPNKQIGPIIEAFESVPGLKEKYSYVIVGAMNDMYYKMELESLIRKLGLEKSIFLLGSQPEEVLNTFIDYADVCINVRYPSTEGGSASIVEQLSFGKPTVVCNTGVFNELPNDVVMKVEKEKIRENLSSLFQKILNNEIDLHLLSTQAKEFARKSFNAAHYSSRLCEFFNEIGSQSAFINFTDRITEEMFHIGGKKAESTLGRISEEISVLFPRM